MATVNHFPFKRKDEDGLILIPCEIDFDRFVIALDTGASHTTIDLTQLLMNGYDLKNSIRIEKVETASGIVDAFVFLISSISCLGITRKNIEINSYDFLGNGLFSDFEGLLGLDFFDGVKFCVDMDEQGITIQNKKLK